ncbi:MAG: LysM domain-containing protein [Candidatus Limivicinus sp.]|jgi:hypothetical protein
MTDSELALVTGGAYTGSVFLYIVRQGENLLSLSRRFDTTVETLRELNPDVSSVSAGTRLLIPLKT